MWVILNDAMLSIVASDCPDLLMVRARVKGDIERVFPKARVSYTPERDYAYRALVPRDVVGAALSARAIGIDYGNFKDSVHEPRRKSIYSRVWETLLDLQGGDRPVRPAPAPARPHDADRPVRPAGRPSPEVGLLGSRGQWRTWSAT